MKPFKEFITEGTLKKQKAPKHGYIGTHKGVEFLVLKDLNSKYWGHIIDPKSKSGDNFEPVSYGWISKKNATEHAIKEIERLK